MKEDGSKSRGKPKEKWTDCLKDDMGKKGE